MKLVCVKTNKELSVKNTKRPKMTSGYFGRTWDVLLIIKINDIDTKLYADTTWGKNCYFEYENKWYSISVADIDSPSNSGVYILKKR